MSQVKTFSWVCIFATKSLLANSLLAIACNVVSMYAFSLKANFEALIDQKTFFVFSNNSNSNFQKREQSKNVKFSSRLTGGR